MNKRYYNQIVFDPKNYKTREEMMIDISCILDMLTKNDYIAVVHREEQFIVVEFEHDENIEAWGCPNPMWVTEEESDAVMTTRCNKEDK